MRSEIKVRNYVLVGAFQPITFDKLFFVKNNIFKEEDLLPNSISTIDGVQLMTNDITVLILINQIIVSSKNPKNQEDGLSDIFNKIILASGLNNFTAVGLNFNWMAFTDKNESIEKISRTNFYFEKNKLMSDFFNTADAKFGMYASKNIESARLKFEVKPVKTLEEKVSNNALSFLFNFHLDIVDKEASSDLLDFIKKYDAYKKESEKIIFSFK